MITIKVNDIHTKFTAVVGDPDTYAFENPSLCLRPALVSGAVLYCDCACLCVVVYTKGLISLCAIPPLCNSVYRHHSRSTPNHTTNHTEPASQPDAHTSRHAYHMHTLPYYIIKHKCAIRKEDIGHNIRPIMGNVRDFWKPYNLLIRIYTVLATLEWQTKTNGVCEIVQGGWAGKRKSKRELLREKEKWYTHMSEMKYDYPLLV